MDTSIDLEKQLNLIAKYNGITLNLEEKIKLEYALTELKNKEKNEKLYFWGKITGEDSDYFIAIGVNFKGHYEFPEKKYYFCQSLTYNFEELPPTFEYHDKDFLDTYYKPLKGNPTLIIKKYSDPQPIPEGGAQPENPPENPPQENANTENKPPEQTNNQNPEEENLDDTVEEVKQPEIIKENFTEKLKLSYLVRQIDYDTGIIPEGYYKLIPEHEIRLNKSFKGLNKDEIRDISKWMHFRRVSECKRKIIEEDEAVFRNDIFDSIIDDKVKGSWSFELDPTKTTCNLRSLLWPGYFALHQANTKTVIGIYFGNGFKNAELPFMV
jgi:radial spoke head protein 9